MTAPHTHLRTPGHPHPPPFLGDKRNAIPREASADLLIPTAQLPAAAAAAAAQAAAARGVHSSVEPGLALALSPAPAAGAACAAVFAAPDACRLLHLLCALPHGPVRMSPAMEGLVETSNNLASIKPHPSEEGAYQVVVTTRSSLPASIATERRKVAALAALAGASVQQPPDYAGCERWRAGGGGEQGARMQVPSPRVPAPMSSRPPEHRSSSGAARRAAHQLPPYLPPAPPAQGRPTPTRRCCS